MLEKRYDKIIFAMAENLSNELKQKAGKDTGLVAIKVAIKVFINSIPVFDVEPISGSPTDYLKRIGHDEGITQEKLNVGLEEVFET